MALAIVQKRQDTRVDLSIDTQPPGINVHKRIQQLFFAAQYSPAQIYVQVMVS